MSETSVVTMNAGAMAEMSQTAAENCLAEYKRDKPLHIARLEAALAAEKAEYTEFYDNLIWLKKLFANHPDKEWFRSVDRTYGDYYLDKASAETEHAYTSYLPYFEKISKSSSTAADKDKTATITISVHNYNLIANYADMETE